MSIDKKDVDKLVGKSVVSHELGEDGSQLKLVCADGTVALFVPEGDCCSMSWIESIDDENALRGVIHSIEEIDMPDLGNVDGKRRTGVDRVSYYGLKITTNKGRSVIDYRNDSNGYYGGWLNLTVQP